MASNKVTRYGPIALTNTYTTNILNPPTTTGGTNAGSSSHYIILRHIRIVNKGATAATFRLYLGATGANAAGGADAVRGVEEIGHHSSARLR